MMKMRRSWFRVRCQLPAASCLLVLCCLLIALCAIPEAHAATLTWADNSTNEAGFKIERAPVACTPTPTFTPLADVGANIKTFVDATTTTGTRYCYRVRAWNLKFTTDPESAQYSGYSNTAGIDYPLVIPADPSLLGATP